MARSNTLQPFLLTLTIHLGFWFCKYYFGQVQKYFAQFQQLKSLPPQVTKVKLQLALRPPHVKGVK